MKGESNMSLKRVLGKAVAGAATTGLLVAPLALATSPQLMNVACTDDPTETTTTLRLQDDAAQYGTKNVATSKVSPARAGQLVTFSLNGPKRAQSIDKRINDKGESQWVLPRGLTAGNTYSVSAAFDTCTPSATAKYTITKATAKPAPSIINARRAKFTTTVIGGGGLNPATGPVKFIVRKRGGAVVRDKVDFLTEGRVSVNMKNLSRGRYVLKVRYNMDPVAPEEFRVNQNFLAGATKIAFRVR